MPWQAWVLVVVLGLSGLYKVYMIDRPRDPVTPTEGFWGLAEIAFYIYLVIWLGSNV